LLVAIATASAATLLNIKDFYRLFIVQSGSMSPTIPAGSIVIVKPQTTYVSGDIITFKIRDNANLKNPKTTVTHRIMQVEKDGSSVVYTTKGDKNQSPDLLQPSSQLVLGKVLFHIPWVGFPISYAKTQTGFILLIVIPATLLVYNELLSIKFEVTRLIKERNKIKLVKEDEKEKK